MKRACRAGRSTQSTRCSTTRRSSISASCSDVDTAEGAALHLVGQPVSLSRTPSAIAAPPPGRGRAHRGSAEGIRIQRGRDRSAAPRERDLTPGDDSRGTEMSTTDKMMAKKEGRVGYLIFNNPERHNAVSLEMWETRARDPRRFRAGQGDRASSCSTGAGGKAFVSGADISKFEDERATHEAVARYNDAVEQASTRAVHAFPKPTIAMIRGYCIGGGLGLAVVLRHSHLRRTTRASRCRRPSSASATPIPASSGSSTWSARPSPRKSSSPRANSTSPRRATMGLVNRVVPDAELESLRQGLCRDHRGQRAAHGQLGQVHRRRGDEGRVESATSRAAPSW